MTYKYRLETRSKWVDYLLSILEDIDHLVVTEVYPIMHSARLGCPMHIVKVEIDDKEVKDRFLEDYIFPKLGMIDWSIVYE